MTTPVTPSKAKTWIALAGSVLTFVVPLVVSVEDYLPSPWPAVIGGVIAVLTALGVYQAPYVPSGAVVVPDRPNGVPGRTGTVLDGKINVIPGEYTNPWQ